MEDNLEVTNIYKDVEKAQQFQNKIGLKGDIRKYREFYKGNQWSKATNKNMNFPRPVFNIIRMIVENKAASIGGNPIQIKFSSTSENQYGRMFNEFAQTILKRLNFHDKLYKSVLRASIDGLSLLHFYWDANIYDDKGAYVGGLNAEIVNVLNIYFSDPEEPDIQKQRWIILEGRKPVSYVRSLCKTEKEKKLIQPDDNENKDLLDNELSDDSLVTVYTKYYRNSDNEVLYSKATKHVVLFKDVFMNPSKRENEDEVDENDSEEIEEEKINKEHIEEYVKVETTNLSNDTERKKERTKLVFSSYPIAICCLNPDEELIYGTSDVKDLINVQRSINASIAFSLLTLQNNGAPKIIAKKGALKGQEITNEVGEVIIDHTPIGTQGLYTLQQQPSVQGALQLAPQMLDFIRTITNTSEIITGDNINTNVSGTAIAQAQSQAKQRIKLQETQLFKCVKDCVSIIEQFQKMYYVDDEFTYKANLNEKLLAMQNHQEVPNYYFSTFNSVDYEDYSVTAEIEVGYGTQYSESLEITMLDNLLANQFIDFDTYVELCPQSVMPFKNQLKEQLQIKQQTELQQVKIQNQQMSTELENLSIYSKQQEKALKDALQNVNREVQLRKSVTSEATSKINQLSAENEKLRKQLTELVSAITNLGSNATGDNTKKVSQ